MGALEEDKELVKGWQMMAIQAETAMVAEAAGGAKQEPGADTCQREPGAQPG